MVFNPKTKLQSLRNPEEKRAIQALMDVIEDVFGFNFIVKDGFVVEIQMVAVALTSVPRTLAEFPNLHKLQLQDNKIRRIKNLENCKALRIINLSNNLIDSEALPILGKLPQLKSLNLSSNRLISFQELQECSDLISLNVANNSISQIPALPSLASLTTLNLSKNPITNLKNIHLMENLTQLNLSNTELSGIEEKKIARGLPLIKEYCANLS